jgi:hypothetical protein
MMHEGIWRKNNRGREKRKGLSHTIQREGKFDVVLPQRRREKRKRSHTSKEQN